MIVYARETSVARDEFIGVLHASSLAARRPVHDFACVDGMLENANLIVTARDGGTLIGVSRSVTDFHYCCYLSDLAVDERYQRGGVGRELIRATRQQLRSSCRLILLAAPAAVGYYPRVGFRHHPQAWVLDPGAPIVGEEEGPPGRP